MSETTYIVVEKTTDPLQVIINCLFEKSGEVIISDKILEQIKQMHSYTMKPNGGEEVYIFNRRVRGTDTLFSFLITTGNSGNKASNLEYISDFGKREIISASNDYESGNNVRIVLKEEVNS